ncbi:type III polyketide synthase [Evansella sp. AB-rgal1]|uniref:type III polyketide synthase n=1 Tax=Evansella sp. AB-rgal1 TaxID=3242696 RepID=UPI00359E0429
MPAIVSVSTCKPPYEITQKETEQVVKGLFKDRYPNIDKLLSIFNNGQIEKRNFVVPKEWFETEHFFEEKNTLFIQESVRLGTEAVKRCLDNEALSRTVQEEEIDAIIFVTSSGLATPTIDARIMNKLPFSSHTKRIPLWGLGCAGGAAGLSRAYEYCRAFPNAKVLVLCIELCSITFQRNDSRKSNLVGTSLFADGVACSLVVGDEVMVDDKLVNVFVPYILDTQSTLMPNSENVMGWDIQDDGLHVIFSRDIPTIIEKWLKPNVDEFLQRSSLGIDSIQHFVAHPGGKKVLQAYEASLGFSSDVTSISRNVLIENGNMSSPTVMYVLKETMGIHPKKGEVGMIAALGPGFSSELLLVEWR